MIDVKAIAESLGLDIFEVDDTGVWIKQWTDARDLESFIFDPINNWQDTGLVLEDLVKRGHNPQFYSYPEKNNDSYEFDCLQYPHTGQSVYLSGEAETLQQTICLAYQQVISIQWD